MCLTLCDPMDCRTPGFPVLHYHPEFAQTHVHWVGDTIQPLLLCCSLLFLPSIFPSFKVFSNESALPIRWSKYWGFSFSISPSNEYSGLISFRIDSLYYWTICLSLGQHHSVLITIGLYLVLKLLTLILPTLFFYFKVFLVFPAF